jgi:hypothetical protein
VCPDEDGGVGGGFYCIKVAATIHEYLVIVTLVILSLLDSLLIR